MRVATLSNLLLKSLEWLPSQFPSQGAFCPQLVFATQPDSPPYCGWVNFQELWLSIGAEPHLLAKHHCPSSRR